MSRPVWGRAWTPLSTLMARAGRWGTPPPPGTGAPVSGQKAAAAAWVVVVVVVVGLARLWCCGVADEQPARARAPARPTPAHHHRRAVAGRPAREAPGYRPGLGRGFSVTCWRP